MQITEGDLNTVSIHTVVWYPDLQYSTGALAESLRIETTHIILNVLQQIIWSFVSPSTLSLISPSGFLLQVSHAGVHTDVNGCVDVCVEEEVGGGGMV